MDQSEFRAMKESGGLVDDAGLQQEETEVVAEEHEEQESTVSEEVATDTIEEDVEEELPPLSEKEKTAFEKRMDRERKKERERLEAEYEQKYGRHKQVVELLGGDPDAIERRIRENQMQAEANRLAEQNGWTEEETTWYVNQRKQEQELKELRVQMQINKLRDNPDYAGIGSMEKEILSKIDKTNGALSVEEAYWALGGPKKAEQIRLEAQMRESVKRQKTPRTVITDSQVSTTTEKPLPADVVRDAERMGISPAEARRLMSKPTASNIDEWRANRKAK